jgi:gentisate 1,2-dioxygenase
LNISDINPFVRYCDIVPAPFISKEFVKTYDGRLFFVVNGEGIFFVGNKIFPFQKNSLILLPAGTRYRFEFNPKEKIELLAINFDFNQDRRDVEKPYKIAFENVFNENLI